MSQETEIGSESKVNCYLLFGTPGYNGTGLCVSKLGKCSECSVYKRTQSNNFKKVPLNLKDESNSKPPEK